MQAGVGLLVSDMMPIYMIMPRYSHNYALFYQLLDSNFFTHRNNYAILREATSETYGPRVYLLSYNFSIYFYLHLLLSNLYHKNTKNIYLIIFIRSHFCKWPWRDWRPLYRVGSKVLICLCRCEGLVCGLLLDWYLGSQNWGKYLRYFAASPFPLQGKTNASSRGSKKDFWHRCRGDLRQVKPYQVAIINSSPLHYIIRHSPLIFLSPTSKMIFENLCLFFAPLPFVSFRLLLVCSCVRSPDLPSWLVLLSLSVLP